MSRSPFYNHGDERRQYVTIGTSKQKVPVLTESNRAEWRRSFVTVLKGTDMEYALDGDQAEADAVFDINYSDDELDISSDEDVPEAPDVRVAGRQLRRREEDEENGGKVQAMTLQRQYEID